MSLDSQIEELAHDHVFLGKSHERNARRTLWVVALTTVMMVVEIVAGILFNSMSLLADGFHMATHAGALGVAALAYAYARNHARSPRYSFGTGKVGDLAGFASAIALCIVALGIGVESVQRLIDPSPVAFSEAMLVAVLGLLVNVVSALLLASCHSHGHGHGHDHDHHHHHDDADHDHRHEHDNNLRSAYLHVLADALTSVLAIAALAGGSLLGWIWLDPVMGLVGASVIVAWSWSLIRDTSSVLLDAHEPGLDRQIRELLEGSGSARIIDLHVWRVGPAAHAAIISVAGLEAKEVRQRLRPLDEIAHLTVEVC